MHSSQRTLLAQLGFSDPDKKDKRHDWACQYLAQKTIAEKLMLRAIEGRKAMSHTIKNIHPEFHIVKGSGQYRTTIGFADLALTVKEIVEYEKVNAVTRTDLEKMFYGIVSTYDRRSLVLRYRPDGTIAWNLYGWQEGQQLTTAKNRVAEVIEANKDKLTTLLQQERDINSLGIVAEVKVNPVPIGDVTRQLELYKTYLPSSLEVHGKNIFWMLVTTYDISKEDKDSLALNGINHLKLGASFDAYCAEREASTEVAESDEI